MRRRRRSVSPLRVVIGLLLTLAVTCSGSSARPELVLQIGHSLAIDELASSADGRWLVSASSDGTVKVWSAQAGDLWRTIPVRGLGGISFSPAGQILAVASQEPGQPRTHLAFYDPETGSSRLSPNTFPGNARSLVYSPDGRLCAAPVGVFINLLEAATGRPVRQLSTSGAAVIACAFLPGGRIAALAVPNRRGEEAPRLELYVWDAVTGRDAFRTMVPGALIVQAGFSLDGHMAILALTSASQGTTVSRLYTWVMEPNSRPQELPWPGETVQALRFFPDGRSVLIASEQEVHQGYIANRVRKLRRWDLERGAAVWETPLENTGPLSSTACLAVIPADDRVAAATYEGRITLFRAASGQLVRPLAGSSAPCGPMVFSPNGRLLAAIQGAPVFWDLVGLRRVNLPGDDLDATSPLAFSPNGRTLAGMRGDALVLWDVRGKGEPKRIAIRRNPQGLRWETNDMAFAPGGKHVVTISNGGALHAGSMSEVRLWDIRGIWQIASASREHVYQVAAFLPSGRGLLTGGQNSRGPEMRLCSIQTLGPIREFPVPPDLSGDYYRRFTAIGVSPDGKLVVAGTNDPGGTRARIVLWDLSTGSLRNSVESMVGDVESLKFLADNRTVCAIGSNGVARLNAANGKTLFSMPWPVGRKAPFASSAGGKRLAVSAPDGGVEIRTVPDGRELATLVALDGSSADGRWVIYTPQGYYTAPPRAEVIMRWREGKRLLSAKEMRARLLRPDLVRQALR